MGAKALIYFEIVTTFALTIGLVVVNLTKPGKGIDVSALAKSAAKTNSVIPCGVKVHLTIDGMARTTEDFNMRVRQYAGSYERACDPEEQQKFADLLQICFEAWEAYLEAAPNADGHVPNYQ